MRPILGVGGLRVIQGSLTLGGLVAFQSLMASFSEPVNNLVNYFGSLQTIKGGLERLEDVYNYPLGPEMAGDAPAAEIVSQADRQDRTQTSISATPFWSRRC